MDKDSLTTGLTALYIYVIMKPMTSSKDITFNNIKITVHSDGSITKPFYSGTKRTFGSNNNGYKQLRVGSKPHQVHRIIAEAFLPDFLEYPEVDHIDGDKTNNDISNLRMATVVTQNQGYKTKRQGCSSMYRGVALSKRTGRWKAGCMINYKPKHVGYFDSEREAAIARDTFALSQGFQLEGLNFPELFQFKR